MIFILAHPYWILMYFFQSSHTKMRKHKKYELENFLVETFKKKKWRQWDDLKFQILF